MRIALFAADQVGLRVARFLGTQGDSPIGLVLDAENRQGLNAEIQEAARIRNSETILTNRSLRGHLAEALGKYKPDLCVLAWWPYILKSDVLAVPRVGCLNFHPSLLPYGRGKAPNFWSLFEGTPFGVTIHWVDDGIDSGDVAFQREIPISWEDSGETLFNKSRDALVELFKACWPDIRTGNIPRIPQPEQVVCHFQRQLEDASQIDLDGSYRGRDMLNLLRARTFEPHPGAWFEDHGRRYEVRISISQVEHQTYETRTVRRA